MGRLGSRLGLLSAFAIMLFSMAVPTAQVSAHADLLRAEPAVDAKLAQPPTQLTLFFSQGLKRNGSFIQLEDSNGGRITAQVSFDDADAKVMRAAVGSLSPGVYTVKWQTLSADDDDYHDGSYALTVLNPDGSTPEGGPTSSTSVEDDESGGSDTVMLVVVTALVVAVIGGLAFYIRKTGRSTR